VVKDQARAAEDGQGDEQHPDQGGVAVEELGQTATDARSQLDGGNCENLSLSRLYQR
jgi:hypothetical protein